MAGAVSYREATPSDVTEMVRCRVGDPTIGPADPRMALYLKGKHHPQHALTPRAMFVCMEKDAAVGYIGGPESTSRTGWLPPWCPNFIL